MDKNSYFFGQSVFGQLISLIDFIEVKKCVNKFASDRYTKKFTTSDHLISMLFATLSHCTSLREVAGGMLGLKGKYKHFQLKNIPYKSTLSDANARRSHEVFQEIYYSLLEKHRSTLSDSRKMYSWENRLEIIDSTTISLFNDLLECVGRKASSGKQKGGIKVHTQMNLQEALPSMVWFSSARVHDKKFLQFIQLAPGKIAVFDKGYNDYNTFSDFTQRGIYFVTRLKGNAKYTSIKENEIPDYLDNGVLKDEQIEVEVKENGKFKENLELRRIAYWDDEHKRSFEFITNLMGMNAGHIALIYKKRWTIELLFKQLKQNFPLKYFLGDNENAIKIQIWCTLITNLLLSVVRKKLNRKYAFSNIVSFCKIHLLNYIHLLKFLENPYKSWIKEMIPQQQTLFCSG